MMLEFGERLFFNMKTELIHCIFDVSYTLGAGKCALCERVLDLANIHLLFMQLVVELLLQVCHVTPCGLAFHSIHTVRFYNACKAIQYFEIQKYAKVF